MSDIEDRIVHLVDSVPGKVNALSISNRLGISYPLIRDPLASAVKAGRIESLKSGGINVYRSAQAIGPGMVGV